MRKSGVLTRLVALILMAAMVLPGAPLSASAEATAQYGYLVIENQAIEDRTVKFRPEPGSSDYIANLEEGWVLGILGTTTYKGELWYSVENPADGKAGYIKGSFIQLMTTEEANAWLQTGFPVYAKPTPTPTPTPTAGTGLGFVRTIEKGVNLRVSPGGTVLTEKDEDKIPEGLVLAYYGERPQEMGYDWVQVIYNGMLGYIRSDCYVKSDVLGNPLDGSTPAPAEKKGHVLIIADKVAIRATPAGEVLNDKDRLPLGAILAYADETELIGKNKWALVTYKGYTGYVRSDCYTYCDESGNVGGGSSDATDAPTQVPGAVDGYVKLTSDDVFIRKTPAGDVLNYYDKLPQGLVLGYTDRTEEPVKGYYWVKVSYNGYNGYIRSDCYTHCDVLGNAISSPSPAPAATPTPTPTPVPGAATGIPKPTGSIIYGNDTYGRTNTDKVFFRKEMSTDKDAGYWALLPYNWLLQALGAEPDDNGTIWYHVKGGTPTNPNQTYTGYIHSDYFNLVSGGKPSDYVPETDSNYAVVTINGINVRSSIGGSAVTALLSNTVVNIITRPTGTSANDWFFIEYNGVFGYVEATALRVLTKDELGNFTLPSAPAPTVTPSPTPAYTGTGFIKIIATSVNIRKTPAGTSLTPKDQDKLPLGLVLRYYEGPTEKISGYYWVKVNYNGINGYVRSDCYMECDMAGNPVTATATPGPTYDPSVSAATYLKLVKGGVNLRDNPWGNSRYQMNKGTILTYLGTKMNGSEEWYEVYHAEKAQYGFILGTMAIFCDVNGNPVTPPADDSTPGPGITYTGYAATTDSSVWVRSLPSTGSTTVGKVLNKGTVLPMFGAVVSPVGSSYSWYPVVLSDGTQGYIRGDFAFELAQWQLDYYKANGVCPTPTPGPATPKPGNSQYIITTGDKLWIRAEASTKAGTLGQLRLGTVTKFYGKTTIDNKNGTETIWYEIKHNDQTGYLHGNYVRVLTNAEYDAYMNQHPELATPTPSPMPDPSTFSDMGMTTVERVKIRGAASMKGAELRLVYDPGTKVSYLGEYKKDVKEADGSSYTWFKVKYSGVTGWMRADCVRILTKDEKAMYDLAGDPDAAPEATYTTLSKGSSGEAVTKLQEKLVEKGYLAATEVNGYYGTSTEQAVIAFQRSTKTLTVDGIAGENTQHALFGTVPVGTYNGSSTGTVLYPVEKIDWYTGGIRNIWKRGEVAVITDVRTGISFRAQHLYGDNHVDIEPLTAADTQAYCQIYGVNNPQEIDDYEQQLQSYRRRPLWVTIDGRTFAASLYGIPHGYPGTDRISDNGFNGCACVHFTNSMTHGDDDSPAHVDYAAAINGWFGHQDAIEFAYKNSQSGTK